MIRTFPSRLNGVSFGFTAEQMLATYVFPGSIDIQLAQGVTMTNGKDAKYLALGGFRGKHTDTNVMNSSLWSWEPYILPAARVWVQNVAAVDIVHEARSYEFEDELVLVGPRLPPRAVELALHAAGFQPGLATWRARATDELRGRVAEFLAALGGETFMSDVAETGTPGGEMRERAQHLWLRWHAVFGTDLEVGGRRYQVRGRPTLEGDELRLQLRHASSRRELNVTFNLASHPQFFDTTVEFEDHTLRRDALAWEDFPGLAEEIDAAITSTKKGRRAPAESTQKIEAKENDQPRPRAGAEAAKAVARRLQALLTGSLRIDRYNFRSPDSEAVGDHVVVRFQSSDGLQLTLYVAPRQEHEVDLRGEMTDEDGLVVQRFDWTIIQLAELIALKETSFARWFGVPVEAEQKLSTIMMEALAALHAEEDAQPWEPHSWPGVHDSTRDALVARGLVVALDGKHGGFPHYKTTPAGRAILHKRTAPPAAQAPPSPQVAEEAAADVHHYDQRPPKEDSRRPEQEPAARRGGDVANTYEVARSAIRALGLPVSKYASYLRQAEAAITDGKSYEPVLKRARKAADKLGLSKRPKDNQASPAGAPRSTELATILDTFNDEPRFRLASLRQGAGTQTYVVFREGSSEDDAIAAIDVVNYDVDGVRWLDLRVPANDQDAILERMDRALWAAADADNAADDDARSPLQDLSDMMERLVQTRGVDVKASENPKRADGYVAIAEALAELAAPAPMDAMRLEVWLESTGVFIKAAEVVADARGDDIKVPDLMRRLWREVLLAVPVTTISPGPSPVPAKVDAASSGTLVIPDSALRRVRADGGVQATVLERHIRQGRATLREVVVRVRGDATRPKWSIVSDATERLQPGAALHDNTHPDEFLRLLYSNINAFEDHLAEAPKRLADVRTLLYWTAAMLDAPLCQGEVKRRATEALQQAQGYYDAARRQLIDGRTVDGARRIHEALRRISAAAAELAKSCGDGQTVLPGAAPVLEVTPADRGALSLPTAAAPAARTTAGLVRPATAMMALVKPTTEQLRARFTTPSRPEDAKAVPIYYIFRSRSGLPELLTREDIEAQARDAVGHEVYDEAERNPMPGAELFESAIGAVELLLDAEFEGRADPRWASSILLNQQMNANAEKQS